MKKMRSEKGSTVIDAAIAIIVIFIFVSIISILSYNYNSSANELKIKSDALYIAVDEIEKIKAKSISDFTGMDQNTTEDEDGNSLVNQPIVGQEGFYKTISILDYKDINESEEIEKDVAKKITVKISYMFKGKEQSVELSTILTKES